MSFLFVSGLRIHWKIIKVCCVFVFIVIVCVSVCPLKNDVSLSKQRFT